MKLTIITTSQPQQQFGSLISFPCKMRLKHFMKSFMNLSVRGLVFLMSHIIRMYPTLCIIQCDADIQEDKKITCGEEFDEYLKTMKIYQD